MLQIDFHEHNLAYTVNCRLGESIAIYEKNSIKKINIEVTFIQLQSVGKCN